MEYLVYRQWILNCRESGAELNVYEDIYRKFVEDVPDNLSKEDVRRRQVEALCLLKELNLPEPLIYILEQCEPENHISLLQEVYEEELKQSNMNWVDLLYIMSRLDESELQERAAQYFRKEVPDTKKYALWLGNALAKVIHNCFSGIEKHYFRIVEAIASVIEDAPSFLHALENRMKIYENSSAGVPCFITIDKNLPKEYFEFLCEKEAYAAATSFLDRIWKPNPIRPKKLFGRELEEVHEILFRYPDPGVLSFGREYTQLWDKTYNHVKWYEEVLQHAKQAGEEKQEAWQSVLQWMRINLGIVQLYQEQIDDTVGNGAVHALETLAELSMYDVRKYSYMTQMCSQLATVIQSWMLHADTDDEKLIYQLRLLSDKNLFSYQYYAWYTSPYKNYDKIKRLDWKALINRLQRITNVNHLVYVFFNTPLWLRMDFYEFILLLSNKVSAEIQKSEEVQNRIQKLLADYPVAGYVIYENRSTLTGRNRFQLVPRYLYWKRAGYQAGTKRNAEDKATAKYERTIYVTENWLSRNSQSLHNFSLQTTVDLQGRYRIQPLACTFFVYDYSDDFIWATDLKRDEVSEAETDETAEEQAAEEKEAFCENLNHWFSYIQDHACFIKWGQWGTSDGITMERVAEPLKVKFAFSMEERVALAERFAELVVSLAERDEAETWKLLHNCSFRPLENVNEFRYIASQRWNDFSMDVRQEEKIYRLAERLMGSKTVEPRLKLEIYMNTCIKKAYPLEKMIQECGEIKALLFDYKTEWIVPIKFMGHRENYTIFSMEPKDETKQNVMKSKCEFRYWKRISVPSHVFQDNPVGKFVMFATMRAIKGNVIELGKYYFNTQELEKHFPWREYKKCYYDLKKRTDEKQLLRVFEKLSNLKVFFDSPEKFIQAASEMDEVFVSVSYDVECLYRILMTLGKKNAFYDVTVSKALSEEKKVAIRSGLNKHEQRYINSYQLFLENERTKKEEHRDSTEWIGTVYYLSHFCLMISEEQFVADLVEKLGRAEEKVRRELAECKERLEYSIGQYQEMWELRLNRKKTAE